MRESDKKARLLHLCQIKINIERKKTAFANGHSATAIRWWLGRVALCKRHVLELKITHTICRTFLNRRRAFLHAAILERHYRVVEISFVDVWGRTQRCSNISKNLFRFVDIVSKN